jgi:hypothetical protein
LALAAGAPPVGLIVLGLVFNSTPIELRYLAFSTPFIGLLLAGALASVPRRAGLALGALVACTQALALLGLLTRPETMQPARATAAAAAALAGRGGLVLLPRGNDGVGVVGPFLAESPDWLRVLIVRQEMTPHGLATMAKVYPRVVLALIGVDDKSRAVLPVMRAAFANSCWRQAGSGVNVVAFDRICGRD